MDDSANVAELLEELGDNIDDLETALEPLLKTPISALSKNLAPLEKAKLLTWLTYAIETILFSYIRLNGTENPKSHPVMTELKRIQQYMQKIQEAENPEQGKRSNMSLDKSAAGRFIKAGLAGNDNYDKEVAQRKAQESEGARRKLQQLDLAAPAPGVPTFEQLIPGNAVSIKMKKVGKEAQGIVAKILSKKPHQDGVKVELQDGRIGRATAWIDEKVASASAALYMEKHGAKKRKVEEEDEPTSELEGFPEDNAMDVDQAEAKSARRKPKLSPEQKKKKKDKKAQKQKEGG